MCFFLLFSDRSCTCLQLREPFNVMAILKSPMGLMVGFMVVVVFLMPKLMENIGTFL